MDGEAPRAARLETTNCTPPIDGPAAAGVCWERVCCPRGGGVVKQLFRALLVGSLVALALFGFAAAGPFEDGRAAYNSGDYATATRIWRPMAERGDAVAQYKLGFKYQRGLGLPHERRDAAILSDRKAAALLDGERT